MCTRMCVGGCDLLFAYGTSLSFQKVGCENVVGSPLQEDKCGVCGGDGTRCKTHRFNFTFTDKKGRATFNIKV